ncbi:DUF4219 domain-containing protein [Tanacetum coccineum]
MVTRFCVGTNHPIQRLNLYVSSSVPLSKSYSDAFNDLNWQNAMFDEYNVLIKMLLGLLCLDPQMPILFIVEDIDVDETFSPVVKPGTIQTKYAVEIIERTYMVNCNPSRTLVDTESKLGDDGDLISDPTLYVRGTLDYRLHLFSSSTTSLVANSDADWAGCPTTRRSTFMATTYSLGPLSVNRHFLILVYRQSIVVRVLHVPSRYQYADIFTKGLPSALFEEFHVSLSVWCSPAQTVLKYLWHIILNGDFSPVARKKKDNKFLEVVPFEEQSGDLKKKLAKNNEAKMVLYNALPKKEYETVKDIWKSLLITHQGNSKVKDKKIDPLVQQYEQFTILKEESTDEGFSSKNHVRKFLRALHPKWRAKVTTIEKSKDLSSLALDEFIGNLKVHEVVMEKDSKIYRGKKEKVKSIALKVKKESSDDETSTSVNIRLHCTSSKPRIYFTLRKTHAFKESTH